MNQWPELIASLLLNVTNAQSTEAVKEASLESIGYICEEIVSELGSPLVASVYVMSFIYVMSLVV